MRPLLLLHEIGAALWGPRWQSEMAEALGVSDRTVRRWVAGDPIPPGVWGDLARMMQNRTVKLGDLLERAESLDKRAVNPKG